MAVLSLCYAAARVLTAVGHVNTGAVENVLFVAASYGFWLNRFGERPQLQLRPHRPTLCELEPGAVHLTLASQDWFRALG